MRAFTRDHAPPGAFTKRSIAAPTIIVARTFDAHNVGDGKASPRHNVGGCGGGCSSCGCGPRAMIGPPLTYPAGIVTDGSTIGAVVDAMPRPAQTPYVDPAQDFACMTPVSSGAPQTIAAGASAVLTIGPTRGMLDMYYLKIIGLNPATGLEVDPASYRLTPPRVADCPQPCDSTAMRGGFYRGTGEGCCGCRWRAIVGRNADGEAMTFTVTNDGVAAASFQAVARGYCVARSLCIAP